MNFIYAQLRQLNRNLRNLPREERTAALESYRLAFEESVCNNYPNRFTCVNVDTKDQRYAAFILDGKYLGSAFGSLEVEGARETVLAEIERRKVILLRKSLVKRLTEFLLVKEVSK